MSGLSLKVIISFFNDSQYIQFGDPKIISKGLLVCEDNVLASLTDVKIKVSLADTFVNKAIRIKHK